MTATSGRAPGLSRRVSKCSLHAPFTIAPYKYTALNREASEIRLMTLLPGVFGSEVRINIQNIVLSKSRIPIYEALSYAWGSNEKSANIRVEELEEVRTLAVTSNLAEALQYLRFEKSPRILWIDAICVDQRNVEERGHQVPRMVDIYRSASPVVIWLGPESSSGAEAMTELSALGSTVRVDWVTTEITPLSGEAYQAWLNELLLFNKDHSVWQSIEQLLDRLWFKRLWIWQEVRLAKQGMEILCGDKTMEWETFRNAIWCINLKLGPGDSKLHTLASRVLDLCYYSGPLSSLEAILHRTRNCQYSDPRDKIYAILNLIYSSEVSSLEADYSKSTEEVFQNIVLNYLSTRGALDILSQCQTRTPKAINVPSWVPDWTVPNEREPIPRSKACWASEAQALFNKEGVLKVTARCVANIDAIPDGGRNLAQILSEDKFVDTVRMLMGELRRNQWKDNAPTDDVSTMEALCRTLCCNSFAESYLPPTPGIPRFQECQDHVVRIIESTALPSYKMYHELIINSTNGRAFFTTVEGYIGLAPREIRPGDQVCIVLGCQSPLVLRANEDGDHTVIGECYLHGVEDGAGLLGKLPGNWQRVDQHDPDSEYHHDAFINHDTGAIQLDDPRLGPLPPGWNLANHEYSHFWNKYSNDASGIITHCDPRMSPEALKARGVLLQEFRLV